jgi:hypothetical protein
MHRDYTGYTPLTQYGWPHQNTPEALARNREGVAKFVELLHSSNAGIKSENDGSIADLNLGAPDCSQRDGCRLNPSTMRSRHFIWQAMQRSCIDGCKLCETARRRCPNGVRKNLRTEVEKTSFAAIALATIGTVGG